jgi:hypothetical protein
MLFDLVQPSASRLGGKCNCVVMKSRGAYPSCEQREPDAIGYAKHRSRSHDVVICVYDEAGNVIETHEHASGLGYCVTRSSPAAPIIMLRML